MRIFFSILIFFFHFPPDISPSFTCSSASSLSAFISITGRLIITSCLFGQEDEAGVVSTSINAPLFSVSDQGFLELNHVSVKNINFICGGCIIVSGGSELVIDNLLSQNIYLHEKSLLYISNSDVFIKNSLFNGVALEGGNGSVMNAKIEGELHKVEIRGLLNNILPMFFF
jgi:hypothetical protein